MRLGSSFNLFGRGAASLLIGDLNAADRETDTNGTDLRDLIANLQRTQCNHTVPVLKAAIGLDWQASLGRGRRTAHLTQQHHCYLQDTLRYDVLGRDRTIQHSG